MYQMNENIKKLLETAEIPLDCWDGSRIIPYELAHFSQIFAQASKTGVRLAVRGASTQGKSPLERLEVCALKLVGITDGEPGDLLLNVYAGTSFNDLKSKFASCGIRIDDYPGTVGGCLCGSRENEAHFQLASRVMGLTYINPAGKILELGSKTIKDVAGYRIWPLLFGSRGKIGLMAKVTINTAPLFREETEISSKTEGISPVARKAGDTMVAKLIDMIDPAGIFS